METTADRLYGRDPALLEVIRAARLAAATDVTVLILGESGTGKELLARTIHEASRRASGPFVAVNCAGLSPDLSAALLCGHRRGSFTGALADRPGYVQAAAGGTLFLDEVGELAPPVQAKLLRLLESGECQVLGAARPERAQVRVLAATHRDLRAEVAAGRFREDLYYRLHVVPLTLPPLRERRGDIEMLLLRVLADLATSHGLAAPTLATAALGHLRQYAWPGNVRELRNLCERLVILFSGRRIEVENLPAEVRHPSRQTGAPALDLPPGGLRLEDLEVQLIRQALARTGGNRTRAARLLGLTRDTLLYRLKKHAIVG